MTNKVFGNFGRRPLWLLPIVLVVAAVALAMPWAKRVGPLVATALGEAGVMLVAGYCVAAVLKRQRRMDEVHLAAQGFANSYGWIWGGLAASLLLMLPPIMNWMVHLVHAMVRVRGTGPSGTPDGLAVQLAFFYGVALVMVVQALGVCVASIVWWRRMGGFRVLPRWRIGGS